MDLLTDFFIIFQVKRETFVEVGLMEDNRDTSSADEQDSGTQDSWELKG